MTANRYATETVGDAGYPLKLLLRGGYSRRGVLAYHQAHTVNAVEG